ncbi:DegT/DnrJ/EryC1/StrS family aminotransferase [Halochromatium salexigens]|uniref:DegT/DnrJ/EryC1/StrS family aminotransferase n=1 Tax=Halochromatium salexigens TaxID=49447 RepID=UPI001F5CCD4A|nr:DegT/DnrJ/EryC1/StrS family aminotransferase [Halochromatium salexigens]
MQNDPDSPALSPPAEPWYYQQIELGYNYRITDIQAALGLSQLQRIDDYIARRQALAERYDQRLAELPVRTPYQARPQTPLSAAPVPDPSRRRRNPRQQLPGAALDAYAEELRDWPHPRSRQGVEHLARWRGATVGCVAAEAFVLARQLQ